MYTDDEPFKSSSILRFICETSAIFALSSFFNLCPGDINREKARERERKNGPWAKDETKRANYFSIHPFNLPFLFVAVLILPIDRYRRT